MARFEELAEGGFNRTFLITMHDGFKFVGRNPYPVTEPKHLIVASELRRRILLAPNIFFMGLVDGTNLGDIWVDLSKKARITVVTKLVEFPASDSLYYTKDLPAEYKKVDVPIAESEQDSRFCIGPDTRLSLWYGKRLDIQVDRGRYMDPTAAPTFGAKKQIAHLTKFGQPLHPFQRLRREIYDYQKQSPSDHLDNLEKYLRAVPYIMPTGDDTPTRPILRHPDLQPNNVFISDDLNIFGLIDWQHCAILPLFLQCGIPNSLQNYGDSVSESLTPPELPHNFDDVSESEQFEQDLLLRRRQLHYFHVATTAKFNSTHYDALTDDFSAWRRKLFDHASDPWEGDNVTLKADLIQLMKNWSSIATSSSSMNDHASLPYPINFSEDEISECLRLNAAQIEADEQLQTCREWDRRVGALQSRRDELRPGRRALTTLTPLSTAAHDRHIAANAMNLTAYSDSESDGEAPPVTTSVAKPLSKSSFQRVVDRSNPGRIKVNLPGATQSHTKDNTPDDAPPSKKPRLGGGGLSGFNAMLPAPKKPNANAISTSASSNSDTRGLGKGLASGVNLKTGAEPAFKREPRVNMDEYDENGNVIKKEPMNKEDFRAMLNLPSPKTEKKERTADVSEAAVEIAPTEPQEAPKPAAPRFVPMSVGKGKKKKKPTISRSANDPENTSETSTSAPSPSQPLLEETAPPPRKPKLSLFGVTTNQTDPSSQPTPSTPYQPLLYNPSPTQPTPQIPNPTLPSPSSSSEPPALSTLASTLHLTPSELRQLLPKQHSKNPSAPKILTFNTDAEGRRWRRGGRGGRGGGGILGGRGAF
ncbi:predicted protein [Plenodomus lingam JN3]|uniref:Predicted protein n=1 Tax=Leptosphaeria maculans (strain JN3 / isolate v23.1.3 / race Av1-4-5-6-7-8) TaxID=985895 RepID=E5A118_LEPMJ|nr:predicted protein [Plenodomus lingam JN3]CBX97314.1 predicted protein [Plenodomus lingam JN3]